jgi:hypothetical protein
LGKRDASYLLIGEKFLHLPRARLTAKLVGGAVEISTNVFAYQVALQVDDVTGAVFEDNFFHMSPGAKRTIRLIDTAGGGTLTVRALNAKPVRVELR